ncbi:hypothetical protein C8R42DRAFT_729593 [Lentinula raphanica]|nr:hypothetical protein C8R42DRAFT_729593 [Lentinula raphanica]
MTKRSSSNNSHSDKSSKKPKIDTSKPSSSSKAAGKKKSSPKSSQSSSSLKPGTSSKPDSTSASQAKAESSTKLSTVDTEEKYMDTLKSKEENPQSSKIFLASIVYVNHFVEGPKLNAKELNVEYDNVEDILFSDDERNPKLDASEEEESDPEDIEDGGNNEDQDNMLVEDITSPEKHKKSKNGWKTLKNVKIVEGDFDNLEFARLAKACMRLSVCIIDMWPKDSKPTWKLFKNELAQIAADGSADEMVESLNKVRSDVRERQKLIKFMGYGGPLVRWSICSVVRLLTPTFYGLSGKGETGTNNIRDLVEWLLDESRYHEKEVDTEKRTVVSGPFATPLLGQIFRAYFIESNPSQDQLLVDYLKSKKKIPRRLIVMVTCLICHAIDEWSRGYKSEINLARAKVEPHYRALWTSMKDLHASAPTYTAMIQKNLYKEMIADSPLAHPAQKYDYAHLETIAQAEMKKSKPKDDDSEEETDSDSEGEDSSSENAERSTKKGKEKDVKA